jgi:xylulokinase
MEGATLGMNHGLRRLTALGVTSKEIRLTGGGARSAVWRQLMADIFGVPVVKMVQDEGAALGGAIQAAWCDGLRAGAKPALVDLCARSVEIDASTRCVPDAKRKKAYRAIQEKFDALTVAIKPFFD